MSKLIGKLLRPIEGEEWIEKKRETAFWIAPKAGYPQQLYSRLIRSYVGWWSYFRLHSLWGRAALLVDPLNIGGLWPHVRCFLFNALVVDVWWALKHRVWKRFHRCEWQEQRRFMDAGMQAMIEGYADPMPPPPGFEGLPFYGSMLGERYFKRVAEILSEGKGEKPKVDGRWSID